MYCNACGSEIHAHCRYCSQCGRALPLAASAPAGRRIPLERPRQGRKIAGVCLALANSMDVDVNLVRVLWVVITVLGALVLGVLAYVVAWILIPEEPIVVAAPLVSSGPAAGPGAPLA